MSVLTRGLPQGHRPRHRNPDGLHPSLPQATVAEGNEDNNGGFFTLDVTEPALAAPEGPPRQLEPAPALPFDGVQALTQPTRGAAEDLASFRPAPTPR